MKLLARGAVEGKTHCTGSISEIHLSNNDITSEGVKHLLSFPNRLINTLKTLNLRNNKLDSESCTILADLIPRIPHLEKLYLSNNNIGQGRAVPLMKSLTAHNSLKTLMLKRTGIGVEDCEALEKLLPSLQKLNIQSNDLPPEAVDFITRGLIQNTGLSELSLSDLLFLSKNTISLASVLETNHTLVYLDIEACHIGSDGACQLAKPLFTNNTLRTFRLCNNQIRVEGATAFAAMLLKNKFMKQLSLLDDSIGKEGTQKLIDSLTNNTTVERLELPKKYKSPISSSRVSFEDYEEED